jgi:hypothetical protein
MDSLIQPWMIRQKVREAEALMAEIGRLHRLDEKPKPKRRRKSSRRSR